MEETIIGIAIFAVIIIVTIIKLEFIYKDLESIYSKCPKCGCEDNLHLNLVTLKYQCYNCGFEWDENDEEYNEYKKVKK